MLMMRGGDRLAFADCSDHDGDVDLVAWHFAGLDAVTADARVEALVTNALQRWRMDDAMFWQRVMFKSRLVRAGRGVTMPAGQAGERTC